MRRHAPCIWWGIGTDAGYEPIRWLHLRCHCPQTLTTEAAHAPSRERTGRTIQHLTLTSATSITLSSNMGKTLHMHGPLCYARDMEHTWTSSTGEAEPWGLLTQQNKSKWPYSYNVKMMSEILGVTSAWEGRNGHVTLVLDSVHGEADERTLKMGTLEQQGLFSSLPCFSSYPKTLLFEFNRTGTLTICHY